MCVLIFSTTFVWNFSHSKNNSARYYHKCTMFSPKVPLFLSGFSETWIYWTDLKKNHNIKFPEYLSSGSRIVPCGQTDVGTDMTKVMVTFRSFANASKKKNHWFQELHEKAIRPCNTEHLVACPRVQAAGRWVQWRCGVALFCCRYFLRCDLDIPDAASGLSRSLNTCIM